MEIQHPQKQPKLSNSFAEDYPAFQVDSLGKSMAKGYVG